MKKPALVSKTRKTAIHWLRMETVTSKAFRQVTIPVVACGRALDERGFREQTTHKPSDVTCAECYLLANPPKSTMY